MRSSEPPENPAHGADGRSPEGLGRSEALFTALYEQIHRLADRQLNGQAKAHTLQPTDLVNEAFLKLQGHEAFASKAHFMGTAARAMRSILVDHARRKKRKKRTAEGVRVPLDGLLDAYESRTGDMILLDEALSKLAAEGEKGARAAQVFELLFFCGLTHREAADMLEVSESTVDRSWRFAQAFLREWLE